MSRGEHYLKYKIRNQLAISYQMINWSSSENKYYPPSRAPVDENDQMKMKATFGQIISNQTPINHVGKMKGENEPCGVRIVRPTGQILQPGSAVPLQDRCILLEALSTALRVLCCKRQCCSSMLWFSWQGFAVIESQFMLQTEVRNSQARSGEGTG